MANSQPQFAGMPEPRPGLSGWTDFAMPDGEIKPVYKVEVSFSGNRVLEAGNELDEALARRLRMGEVLTLQCMYSVARVGHKNDDGKIVGLASAKLDLVSPSDDLSALTTLDRINRIRDAARAVERAADLMSDQLSRHIRIRQQAGQSVPTALEDAHDDLRAELAHLMAEVN